MASISSATSSSSLSSLTAKTGIGGLVSGMDIDELVESLTISNRTKIAKQKQALQLLEWKQTAYRTVHSSLTEFQSKYFDVLSSTNLGSESFFNTQTATSSSSSIQVKATAEATAGTITINSITQLATYSSVKSTEAVSSPLTGTESLSGIVAAIRSESTDALAAGDSIKITLNGTSKTITFDQDFIDAVKAAPDGATAETVFLDEFQSLVEKAFGTGTVSISAEDDVLSITAAGSNLTLYSSDTDTSVLEKLGFTSGQSNLIKGTSAVKDVAFKTALPIQDSYTFTINGEEFTVSKDDTLNSVLSKINSSDAGVKISYSSITDTFSLTSTTIGAGANLVLEDTDGFLASLGLAQANVTEGENAKLMVNGQEIIRNSNTFSVDGVEVTLIEETTSPVTITVTEDSTSLMESIKGFVNDYNTMIDLINSYTKEEVYSDYDPLTDEQKEEMSETEIKTWEEKAKSGVLRSDTILMNISSKLHDVMTGYKVGASSSEYTTAFSLYSMGITSAGYTENGKLKIDEAKLKTALETNPSQVKELFSGENGIASQLDAIIEGATKTTGGKGKRGTLVEAAGVASTTSATENVIYERIKRTNEVLETLQDRLTNEETRLWNKFSAMEQYLSQLNSQSSMLTQFSSGG